MIAKAFCEFAVHLASPVRRGDALTCSVGHFSSNKTMIGESLRYSTLQSVPDYMGDAKDNQMPMLVRKHTMLEQSMSSCIAMGESGVASCWGFRFMCLTSVLHCVPVSFLCKSVPCIQGLLCESLWMRVTAFEDSIRLWLRQ